MRQSFAAGFVLLLATGCGHGIYVPVSGVVTYNDEPLTNAVVTFQPEATAGVNAAGVGSTAKTDGEGKFALMASTSPPAPGAVVGKHVVRIGLPPNPAFTSTDSDAVNVPGREKVKPATGNPIPAKYNDRTELTFEVPASGTTGADFKLTGPALPMVGKK